MNFYFMAHPKNFGSLLSSFSQSKSDKVLGFRSSLLKSFSGGNNFLEQPVFRVTNSLLYSLEESRKLKLASSSFIKFLIFHQMIALQKLSKMFFISSTKPFSRYSNFYNFFPSFPHFLDSKGQMKVE